MSEKQFVVEAAGGVALRGYAWDAVEGDARGVVQIVHGMAEHAGRYEWFARRLGAAGYVVYAHDQRGHGLTVGTEDTLGHFADDGGWELAVDDIGTVYRRVVEEQLGRPVFLLGHSAGSLLVRDYAGATSDPPAGIVLTATSGDPGFMGEAGVAVARTQRRLLGPATPSRLMDRLLFGGFNKAFRPNRTAFDWLSRDAEQVDAYIRDPLCGQICTTAFFADLVRAARRVNSSASAARLPVTLPVLIASGARDPLGENGAGIERVRRLMDSAGMRDVSVRLYEEARHEIINETNREEVTDDIISWLDARV